MTNIHLFSDNFKPLKIGDQQKLELFLKKYPHLLSGYTFASLFSWNAVYSYAFYFIEEETLLISFESKKRSYLLEPIGIFSEQAQKKLLKAIQKEPIEIVAVSENFIKNHQAFCSFFDVENERDYANYLYLTKDLVTLAGRHYEKKRNLLAQAKKLYSFEVEPLTKKCYPHCPKILIEIGNTHSENLQNELKALDTMLLNFQILDLKGVVINIEGKSEAFSIYGKLNESTADIYFEKANKPFKGLYQIINQETAKAILKDGYSLINREEDLGIEGLRQAKSSYFPTELIPSYSLKLKG
ncbi:MAG TPA: phosphatidylglycerol lysyltransferase domain-containing protein [Parachlamydiaceae bacterium]|nr:phosphatidylglycerol lysyltransferase domain-containing protein [Parachlamydiaceae bacterium]